MGGARDFDAAVVHDVGAIDDGERLAHLVIGDQDAETAIAQLADHRLDVGDRDRIDAGERFVEQEKRRLRRDRARDLHAPALAAREAVAARVDEFAQTELFQQHRQPAVLLGARTAVQLPDQANVVADRELAEDRVLLREIADAVARALVHRPPGEVDLAPSRSSTTLPPSGFTSPTTM